MSAPLLLSLCAAFAGADPPVVELAAYQRTWLHVDGTVVTPFSNHGELGVTTLPDSIGAPRWFNARIDGAWLIRNVELPTSANPDDDDAAVTAWLRFPLPLPDGISFGVPVELIAVEWALTGEPLDLFDGGTLAVLTVQPATYLSGLDEEAPMDPPAPVLPFVPQPAGENVRPATPATERVTRSRVPGVSEGVNRCAPGAHARCIAWLADALGIDLPEGCSTPQEIYAKLDQLMGSTRLGGTANFGLEGLHAFLATKGLDDCFTVRKRRFDDDPATPEDLLAAMKRGYDVILLFGWWDALPDGTSVRRYGHQGTMTDIRSHSDGIQIWYRDDTEPNGGQGDGEPDRGRRKATLQKQTAEDGTQTWWVPEEGTDSESGLARSMRWEGYLQICPTRLKLAEALDRWVRAARQAAIAIEDSDNPTAAEARALRDRVRRSVAVARWLKERFMGETGWPAASGGLIERIMIKALLAELLMNTYLDDPDYDRLLEVIQVLDDILSQWGELDSLLDCNSNAVSDELEIERDPSLDANGNGVLDECERRPSIPGDINGDGIIDGADIGLLLAAWLSGDPAADLNGDGVVDGADLGLILSLWSP
ncbi:MAG TPA: dockerin type I repeat-containing protein [Phycisphaerales bacterium]|nr:dockerin type I repeat-containing protein [Phycisphaerales bacterium]HMP36361.1 dockerin type I repeat-containing protein [Phycisphaerales bacterium]